MNCIICGIDPDNGEIGFYNNDPICEFCLGDMRSRWDEGDEFINAVTTATSVPNTKAIVRFIAVRNRAAGSPSVYFGPFLSYEAAQGFIKKTGIAMGIIELLSPMSDPSTWWG